MEKDDGEMKKVKRAIALTAALAMTAMSVPAVFAEDYSDAVVSEARENGTPDEAYTSNFDVANTKISGDWIYAVNNDGATCSIIEYIGAGGDVVIPETIGAYTVTQIYSEAFMAVGLTGITIPSTVTYIATYIHTNYVSDEEKTDYTGTTWWNPYNKGNSLASIKVAEGNKNYTSVDGVLYNYKKTELIAYPGAKKGTSFTVPSGVTSINEYAFRHSKFLTNITLPDTVNDIGWSAFQDCAQLKSINLPDGLTRLSSNTFTGCTSLSSISIPDSVTAIEASAFENCTGLSSITIPNNVNMIGSCAFKGCSSLASVTIPANVSSVGYGAFCYCTKLKSIKVSSDNQYYCSVSGILYDKNMTELTAYPAGLTAASFAVSSGISSIGNYAFAGAVNLSSISIPSSVITINADAFRDCTNLSDVKMNVGLKVIDDSAFYNCSKLLNVVIPDGVIRIGESAFAKRTINFTTDPTRTFTIPASVTVIADYVFGYGYYNGDNSDFTLPGILLRVSKGSFAEQFAQKNHYKYEYIGQAKPKITKAAPGDGQIALNWTSVSGATQYAVYYRSGSSWVNAGTTTACGKYVKGLTNGTKYAFIVKAYVDGAWSASDVVYATPAAASTKPVITKAAAGDSQVALNWTAVSGATQYAVYYHNGSKWVDAGRATVCGKYVKGLTNGKRYGFAVKAYVNGKWTAISSTDIVYATPVAAKASLIGEMTDIVPDLKF